MIDRQILVIVHQANSNPGRIGKLLRQKDYQLDIRIPSQGETLPSSMDNYCGSIVFGGPMSANDADEFIRTELAWIELVLRSNKPFLGICLGAQMLAKVLGSSVKSHPEQQVEIGYYPIEATAEGKDFFQNFNQVYHWHREGFEIPSDAVKLARGNTFANQAFRYNHNAYGLQFHPEINGEMIRLWTKLGADQLVLPGATPRDKQIQQHQLYGGITKQWLNQFLERWLDSSTVN